MITILFTKKNKTGNLSGSVIYDIFKATLFEYYK